MERDRKIERGKKQREATQFFYLTIDGHRLLEANDLCGDLDRLAGRSIRTKAAALCSMCECVSVRVTKRVELKERERDR